MAGKVKIEFARTGIIAFIIVGICSVLVPEDVRLYVFGPVALTLLLGLILGKYRTLPFGKRRDDKRDKDDQQSPTTANAT
jgi:hypothetical protein